MVQFVNHTDVISVQDLEALISEARHLASEEDAGTVPADDTTLRELRALAKTAQVPGYGRLRKADLATAVDPLVGVHDELRLARLARQKQQGKSV